MAERIMDSAADGPLVGELLPDGALLGEGTAHFLAYAPNGTFRLRIPRPRCQQ